MNRAGDGERQNEIERDHASRFIAEQYVSRGYFLHFHRNIEIYGVVKGRVSVSIVDENRILSDGQIAVIDGLENHSYEIDGEAEIFYVHVGTRYLRDLLTLYPNQRLPHWLMDVEYNKVIRKRLQGIMGIAPEQIPYLRRIGVACELFSDIIEHYGVENKKSNMTGDNNLITEIIQYIYGHYDENISLETLSSVFFVSPKVLSKKLSKRLNVDLRVFINDIRVQKAVQMLDDPQYKDKSLNEIVGICGFKNMGTFYRSYERNFKFYKLEKR